MEGNSIYKTLGEPPKRKILKIVLLSLLTALLFFFSLGYGYYFFEIETDHECFVLGDSSTPLTFSQIKELDSSETRHLSNVNPGFTFNIGIYGLIFLLSGFS